MATPRSKLISHKNSTKDEGLIRQSLMKFVRPLAKNDGSVVMRRDFLEVLRDNGLNYDDPRLERMIEELSVEENEAIPIDTLIEIAGLGGQTVLDALSGDMVIPKFKAFKDDCWQIFEAVKNVSGGKNAEYIPQLAKVDPNKFSVAVTTVDGQRFAFGDYRNMFCLQSVSKPVTYCCALKEHGTDGVHQHVGREPSGVSFNAMTLKKVQQPEHPDRTAIPHNPCINAGAIMCTSLLPEGKNQAERLENYLDTWSDLCGDEVGFDPAVMVSERATADRNTALAYMMKECGAFKDPNINISQVLELYFSTCSVTANAQMVSTAAATLANGGVNPLTGKNIFEPEYCRHALALMLSCGMYDFSGEWAFTVGLPAKSGVSGVLMMVVPNVMGIAIWSPPLDKIGNTVKGIEFAKMLVAKYAFHHLDSIRGNSHKIKPTASKQTKDSQLVFMMMYAATAGDLMTVQRLMSAGGDINAADYDRRTVLHLAASEGHVEMVEFLLAQGADPTAKDRWGNTPFDDAVRGDFSHLQEILSEHLSFEVEGGDA